MEYKELKPCQKCGSTNLSSYAFSISEDAGIECNDCGFFIEQEVSWDGCEPGLPEDNPNYHREMIRMHDNKAYDVLKEEWNKISKEEAVALYEKENES